MVTSASAFSQHWIGGRTRPAGIRNVTRWPLQRCPGGRALSDNRQVYCNCNKEWTPQLLWSVLGTSLTQAFRDFFTLICTSWMCLKESCTNRASCLATCEVKHRCIWRTFVIQLQPSHLDSLQSASRRLLDITTLAVRLLVQLFVLLARWLGTRCLIALERSTSTKTPSDGWRLFACFVLMHAAH